MSINTLVQGYGLGIENISRTFLCKIKSSTWQTKLERCYIQLGVNFTLHSIYGKLHDTSIPHCTLGPSCTATPPSHLSCISMDASVSNTSGLAATVCSSFTDISISSDQASQHRVSHANMTMSVSLSVEQSPDPTTFSHVSSSVRHTYK